MRCEDYNTPEKKAAWIELVRVENRSAIQPTSALKYLLKFASISVPLLGIAMGIDSIVRGLLLYLCS